MPLAPLIAHIQPAPADSGVRSFLVYEGEDMLPVYDYTDDIRWQDAEFGGRAYQGEATSSSAVIRDPDGLHGDTKGLWSRNVALWRQGSNTLWRGRVGVKDYSRGPQAVNRYREAGTYLEDYNIDLRGIPVVDWARPAETDQARTQALGQFLNHNPRPTTALDLARYVSGSNLVTLAAKTYTQTDVLGVLSEISSEANKAFFVTVDGELFYDGNDSVVYRCPFSISDREEDVRASNHVFGPIWDSGSAVTEDGQQLLSGLYLYYGGESYVHVSDASVAAQHGFYEETVYDDDATAANATVKAAAILARRKTEDRTVNVTIGPLTDAHVGSIKWGQMVAIKARAIPDADDAYVDRRIVQLKWTTPVPGTFFAHMQLGRPEKIEGYGVGDKALTVSVHSPISDSSVFENDTLPDGTLLGIAQTRVEAGVGVVVNDGGADRVFLGDIDGGDYGLKVVSSDGTTVIIDGTSNMFKIAATGTHSVVSGVGPGASASASVTLTALGALSTTPAHLTYLSNGNSTTANQHLGFFQTTYGAKWVAGSLNGPTDQQRSLADLSGDSHTDLNGSSQAVHTITAKSDASSFTLYGRYYILQEAAL